jgi:hypothetical protein
MLPEDALFAGLTDEGRWQRYCGFLHLDLAEFLKVQHDLLEDQVTRVSASPLGRRILGDRPPRTVEEFRDRAPLTTFDDYDPWLSNRDEGALAAKPFVWCHSSGRGGRFKWVPHSVEMMDNTARNVFAICVLASASARGEVNVAPGLRFLTTLPPPPYTSGALFDHFCKRFTVRVLPPQESVAGLPFQQQVARGFEMALREGFDVAGAIASVLVKMGEQMAGGGRSRLSWKMLHPRTLARLAAAALRSRRQGRPLYPRDLWRPKGILAAGLDMAIYRDDITRYWGVPPFNAYVATEGMVLGMQAWNKKHLTLIPDSVFYEFLPHDGDASAETPLLIDQLEPGRLYELVITQFHGMPLLRYRIGDVLRVASLRDDESGVALPQFEIQRKVGDVINLGSLCSLDERVLWSAIADTGLRYTDWSAFKEYDHSRTFLRLVIELREQRRAADVSALLHARLKEADVDYRDVERYLGENPVRTTLLAPGAFSRYTEEMIRAGADLAHLKPNHINPPAAVLDRLLGAAKVEEEERE